MLAVSAPLPTQIPDRPQIPFRGIDFSGQPRSRDQKSHWCPEPFRLLAVGTQLVDRSRILFSSGMTRLPC